MFFENESYKSYNWDDMTVKKNALNDLVVNSFMHYLFEVVRITNNMDNDLLIKQLNNLGNVNLNKSSFV